MSKLIPIAVGGALIYGGYRLYDSTKKLSQSQRVVIIGGGYAGARLAQELRGRGNYTLIDQRDAMHHNMAALRAAVEPKFAVKSFIPYKPIFDQSFVQGKVVDIDVEKQEVILENSSERIPYSELVIATGARGPFPGKCRFDASSKQLIAAYEDYTQEIQKAENIVIVGGGAVGVEMAGEIATDYPGQKNVTVVHNTGVLVSPVLTQKAQDIVTDKLKQKNINCILNEKVTNLDEIPVNQASKGLTVKLSSGRTLTADLVIPCIGLTVNSEAYQKALGDRINARGQLKVNDNLQVEGTANIFAIGDCNNYDVAKLAWLAQEQGSYVYGNLINIAKGKPITPYKPGAFRICVPIGRDGGISQSGDKVLGDFFTKLIKAKDVFVKAQWKEFGLNPPKSA